jgi:hypothetical protein
VNALREVPVSKVGGPFAVVLLLEREPKAFVGVAFCEKVLEVAAGICIHVLRCLPRLHIIGQDGLWH